MTPQPEDGREINLSFEIPEGTPEELRHAIFERLAQLLAALRLAGAWRDRPRQRKPPAEPWWNDTQFDRAKVRQAIEDATGRPISVDEALPDTLIANAQALGLRPYQLRMWIWDDPQRTRWSGEAMARWARRLGL